MAPPLSPTALLLDVEIDWGAEILAITDEVVRSVAQRTFHEMAWVRTLLSRFQNEITGFTEVMHCYQVIQGRVLIIILVRTEKRTPTRSDCAHK